MLSIENEGGVLQVYADGQLTADDYMEFVTRFEWFAAARSTPILMLIELGPEFGGWSLDALFRDSNFDLRSRRPLGYVAILADERWKEWGVGASYSRLANETRHFAIADKVDAVGWLHNQEARRAQED